MNKTAIKNFAIWARNKLIADISYKAGFLGITKKGIESPLPQSTQTVQFFDIGTKEPSSITGIEIQQRKELVEEIETKAKQSDYSSAYNNVIEEVAYTWFNRLIAIRFMEVNDYLPTRIRVLSSEGIGKSEPDLVTHALETSLDYSDYEKNRIIQLKHENMLDELFRMLFIKQCNALNATLPELFEKTSDYTELLLNVSFTDKEGVVYRLVNDISEDDFNVAKEGQVEIIGWMYQYYNTEPKQAVFDGLKKNVKITRDKIPAATQLFTPDWIVRYMVENSLGRLWLESHPNDVLKENWKYYLDEAEQTPDVAEELRVMRSQSPVKSPEDIRLIDPCMGSGHILVYAFDVLMQIYESEGYNPRDATKLILKKNIYGLDIDRRAYQLAYFSLMMKARQYNRRIFTDGVKPQIYHPAGFLDGEEYGSLVKVDKLEPMPEEPKDQQMTLFDGNYDTKLNAWNFKRLLAQKYDVVVTNPPYMGGKGQSGTISEFLKNNYPDSKSDTFSAFIERCGQMAKPTGYVGMFTPYVWMFIQSYEKLRNNLYSTKNLTTLIQFEYSAFEEATVPVCSFVYQNRKTDEGGGYFRLVDFRGGMEVQRQKYLEAIYNPKCGFFYTTTADNFSKIPGSPVAYWVSDAIFNVYSLAKPLSEYAEPKQGTSTGDNNIFLRLWHEAANTNIELSHIKGNNNFDTRWYPATKGGEFRKWYGNNDYIVDWQYDGQRIANHTGSAIRNRDANFLEALTWTGISSKSLGIRYNPTGFVFTISGKSIIGKTEILIYLLGLLCSVVTNYFLNITSPTMSFEVGYICGVPIIWDDEKKQIVIALVNKNIALSRADWDAFETSWDFQTHPLVKFTSSFSIDDGPDLRLIKNDFKAWECESNVRFTQLKANEEELNRIFIDIYGLSDELTPEVEDKDVTVRRADLGRDIRSLISYAVGCMFGRYSLDTEGLVYAGGDWDVSKYRSFIPDKDNILPICDKEYFGDDILGRFVDFIRVVYGAETLEENLEFIADALGKSGTPREVIRNYLLNDFYKDHCKIYKKRPIYWLFDSGRQNGLKALVYMHRYDEDTIGNLRIDYLHRMQRIYENEILRMQDTIDNSRDAREVTAATKRKEKLIKQLQETKEYDEKIAHLALARISIDLDDGVKVNYEKVQTDQNGKKLDVLAKI